MNKITILVFLVCSLLDFSISHNIPKSNLIRNDWKTLSRETTIRYFNPAHYVPGGSIDDIWNKMGEDITCSVDEDLTVHVQTPPGFDLTKPFKFLTHGFSSQVDDAKTANVDAWMQTTNNQVNVILVDWSPLALIWQIDDWDDAIYDEAARNAIDVGEFLGLCLSSLGVEGSELHLVGHSLGAHLMGKAARTFGGRTGMFVERITGLDPAGPRFVDGPILDAIPELHQNRLDKNSAAFVDIIHTNGALEPAAVWFEPRSGDLHQMGHMDFYPDGGSAQTGCTFGPDALPGGICSHRRSQHYFLHSIWEPKLFPSKTCISVEECNNEQVVDDSVVHPVVFMGEGSKESYQGGTGLFYHDIQYRHWNYYEYN